MGEFLVGAAQNQYFDSVSPLPTLAVLACEPGDHSGEKKAKWGILCDDSTEPTAELTCIY